MRKIIIILLLYTAALNAQNAAGRFIISVNANYTTSSKLYLYPNADDIIVRSNYIAADKIFSPSIDLRYHLTENILIGLSSEKIEETRTGRNITVLTPRGTKTLAVEDGYRLIPFELSLHYELPFSTERFRVYMGGGAAYYYGSRIRKFGDASVSTAERKFAYGIQAIISSDFMITKYLSVRTEMKFRDPEFELRNRYDSSTINYEGEEVLISQPEFDSKINVDGVTFTLGLALHL